MRRLGDNCKNMESKKLIIPRGKRIYSLFPIMECRRQSAVGRGKDDLHCNSIFALTSTDADDDDKETDSRRAEKPEEEEIPFYEIITPVPSSNEDEQLSDEEWPMYDEEGANASCVSSAE